MKKKLSIVTIKKTNAFRTNQYIEQKKTSAKIDIFLQQR